MIPIPCRLHFDCFPLHPIFPLHRHPSAPLKCSRSLFFIPYWWAVLFLLFILYVLLVTVVNCWELLGTVCMVCTVWNILYSIYCIKLSVTLLTNININHRPFFIFPHTYIRSPKKEDFSVLLWVEVCLSGVEMKNHRKRWRMLLSANGERRGIIA